MDLTLTIANVLAAASLAGLTWFKVIKKSIVRDASIDASLKELCGFKVKTEAALKTHQQHISHNTSRINSLEEASPPAI